MQNHPLTPMNDANLVRVLQAQCSRRVGLVDYRVVAQGADAIAARMAALKQDGVSIAIVDAISNNDLLRLAPALKGMPLVTAASGVAIGLPANFGLKPSNAASELPPASAACAIVSGSCSTATRRQVSAFVASGGEAFQLLPGDIAQGGIDLEGRALAWAASRLSDKPILVYSSADPDDVRETQRRLTCSRPASWSRKHLRASPAVWSSEVFVS